MEHGHLSELTGKSAIRVRRERCWFTAGVNPPGIWFAPPGSNPSRSGGHETAEASGAAVVFRDLVLGTAEV